MGLLRKKFVKNGIKMYQKSIIMGYGHEKRFYKILKIRFLNDLASPNASISTRSVSQNNNSTIKQSTLQQYENLPEIPIQKQALHRY